MAKFAVNVINDTNTFPNAQTLDLSVAATETDVSWTFTVENASEVVTEEKVVITFDKDIPTWLTVSMTVDDTVYTPTIDGKTYTYSVPEFSAGDSDTWILRFIGNPNTAEYAEISGQISVYVTQID